MGLFDAFKKNTNQPETAETPAAPSVDLTKKVNLAKEEVHKVCLTKRPLQTLKAKVALVLDYSGSMDGLYKRGVVQDVVERTLPLAMNFDDDGSMECWIFENGFQRLPDVTMNNLSGYVQRETKKYRMGGTCYAPVMLDIANFYANEKVPVYVLFITDGDNSDKPAATKVITDVSKKPIFWQFVGVGSGPFSYLEQLDDMGGRYVDNADFFKVSNAANITYQQLLTEFPEWLENPMVKAMLT